MLAPLTQAEVQALRDKVEELADDVRALAGWVHALRGPLAAVGSVKVCRVAGDLIALVKVLERLVPGPN